MITYSFFNWRIRSFRHKSQQCCAETFFSFSKLNKIHKFLKSILNQLCVSCLIHVLVTVHKYFSTAKSCAIALSRATCVPFAHSYDSCVLRAFNALSASRQQIGNCLILSFGTVVVVVFVHACVLDDNQCCVLYVARYEYLYVRGLLLLAQYNLSLNIWRKFRTCAWTKSSQTWYKINEMDPFCRIVETIMALDPWQFLLTAFSKCTHSVLYTELYMNYEYKLIRSLWLRISQHLRVELRF